MKVNITVVATKTFMAGLEPAEVAILKINTRTANSTNLEDSTGRARGKPVPS
jgi:hypothetical protein